MSIYVCPLLQHKKLLIQKLWTNSSVAYAPPVETPFNHTSLTNSLMQLLFLTLLKRANQLLTITQMQKTDYKDDLHSPECRTNSDINECDDGSRCTL